MDRIEQLRFCEQLRLQPLPISGTPDDFRPMEAVQVPRHVWQCHFLVASRHTGGSISQCCVYLPHECSLKDCGTSISVQLNFKLEHLLSGTCPSGHPSLVALHGIPIVLPLNHFDLRVARAKFGPTTSLTEYFATAIPRIFMGSNMISGSALVHSLPAPRCEHMDCLAQFQPQDIETRWPRILHINPDTGSQPALPITRAFTLSDGSGRSVGYRMVGTMSFDSERQHYTAKIMIDDQSFSYDGLCRGGALVPLGSLI